ncbi:GNAT family N-acetyltransferase [Psychrobacillus vulpis]|uniref:GNAT family N-acetyltransferase n=1 Tax=Psychrobacillus vulpis TaxID=2325572 RepID=A0A544TNU4_9BACI|nr:GNAT family N-acetyltransferase [Psychrobacillus vulpis]TQR19117.1 GNAT family N-acetyltransferase [Psychrobacillus vulpis]
MNYRTVEELEENHLNDLLNLFKNEWWTQNRQLSDIRKMVDNSTVVIGLVHNETEELFGFARVMTDTVYRALIFDVIAKENYRNKGVGAILMNAILEHPYVRDVERVELYCPDRLVGYYEKFGFSTDVNGSNLMRLKK